MICEKCGADWDTSTTPAMFRFKDSAGTLDEPMSPSDIQAAGSTIVACPKDPMTKDPDLGAPDPNTGLQPGRSPDSGERSPGSGDADTVHGGD